MKESNQSERRRSKWPMPMKTSRTSENSSSVCVRFCLPRAWIDTHNGMEDRLKWAEKYIHLNVDECDEFHWWKDQIAFWSLHIVWWTNSLINSTWKVLDRNWHYWNIGTIFLRGNDCVFSSYRQEMKWTIDWSDQCKMLICDLIVNLNRSIGGRKRGDDVE